MRHAVSTLVPSLVVLVSACAATRPADPDTRARELAHELVLCDTHIDVPWRLHEQAQNGGAVDDVGERTDRGDFDYPRAVAGGLDVPFFSIYTPSECEAEGTSKKLADELIDGVYALAHAHPDRFFVACKTAEVREVVRAGRIAIVLGMENGSPLENSLANVDYFFERGVR